MDVSPPGSSVPVLAAADDKFRRLLEATPDAIVIVNRAGRIVLSNSQTERLFGYTQQELEGQAIEILIPQEFRQAHFQQRAAYIEAPRARPMGSGLDLQGRRKDGTTFPVEISLSPVEQPDGNLVMSAIRDISDRRAMEKALRLSEERFRRLIAEVKDYAIFMLDTEGRVQTWNDGARQIKGYTADEIVGRHFSAFYPAEDIERGKPDEELKVAAEKGRWEDEGWRIRKDGSRFWANVVITALHDEAGNLLGFSKVTRDLTDRKRAREAFVLEITNTLLTNLDIGKLLTTIGSCIRQVKDFDFASLAQYDPDTNMFRMYSLDAAGSHRASSEEFLPIAGSPAGWAYTSRKPLLFTGAPGEKLPVELPSNLVSASVKSGCWIPLIGKEGALGVLNIFSRRVGAFSEDDLDTLSQMASQIAVALDNAETYRRMSEMNQRLADEKEYLEEELRTESSFDEIVGESKPLKRVLKQIETVAPTDSTVLILGETGTGKELLARAVHDLSSRRGHPFVRINCAAVPAGLLESELFGHEKGAFTGAIAQRIGRFELAHKGTLFLDEVGEIPLDLQSKLLRVLQEKQFERLGSSRTITTDVRIVAATNRDLGKLSAAGQFRNDLYYRLSVFPVVIPPLRERADDIPLLVQYFLSKFASRMKKNIDTVSASTMQSLTRYSWPGNVRELEHMIERAVILSRGPELRVPAIEFPTEEAATPPPGRLEDIERDHIVRILRETKGKIGGPGGAAERLGMNRTTLNSRMQKLGISRKKY